MDGSITPSIPQTVATNSDSLLFDVFPAQIIGPHHRGRLADLDSNWIRPVSPVREILAFPSPLTDWIPDSANYEATIRRYRQILAPCFSGAEPR
jgi:hypothetical protein